MRERWYGDRRDLVKWSCLLSLATELALRRIVYVACLRDDTTEPDALAESFAGGISHAVWSHFRDLSSSLALTERFGIEWHLIDEPFPASGESRWRYWDAAAESLVSGARPALVFLDPDTGLGSPRSGTHVSPDETQHIWSLLTSGECLVLYQHAWRARDWRQLARQRFADALDVPAVRIDAIESSVSNDVVFLVARKGEDSR